MHAQHRQPPVVRLPPDEPVDGLGAHALAARRRPAHEGVYAAAAESVAAHGVHDPRHRHAGPFREEREEGAAVLERDMKRPTTPLTASDSHLDFEISSEKLRFTFIRKVVVCR